MEARKNIHNEHIIIQKYVGVKVTEVMRYIALVYSLGPSFSSLYICLAVSHTCDDSERITSQSLKTEEEGGDLDAA